jgi:hypothetical protein
MVFLLFPGSILWVLLFQASMLQGFYYIQIKSYDRGVLTIQKPHVIFLVMCFCTVKVVILKNNFDSQIALAKVHWSSFIEICMKKALGGSMWLFLLLPCTFQLEQNFLFWNLHICLKIFHIWQFVTYFSSRLKQRMNHSFSFSSSFLQNTYINSCRT